MVLTLCVVDSFVKFVCWLLGLRCVFRTLYNVIGKRNKWEKNTEWYYRPSKIGVRAHRTLKNPYIGIYMVFVPFSYRFFVQCICAEAVAAYWLILLWRHIEMALWVLSLANDTKNFTCIENGFEKIKRRFDEERLRQRKSITRASNTINTEWAELCVALFVRVMIHDSCKETKKGRRIRE